MLAAIELGRVGVLMVISCDAKMIRSDTQIDYVGGNANEARPTGTLSVLLDLLIKSTLKKFPCWGGISLVAKQQILKKILALLSIGWGASHGT
jgi:hypothetical protein